MCPSLCLRAKDHLSTPSGGLPEVRQRNSLAATTEWRPGRRRATQLPTEERATQRVRQSSVWDTDRVRPTRAFVQAIVVVLHEPAGWGAE